jgi:hypothetical protein
MVDVVFGGILQDSPGRATVLGDGRDFTVVFTGPIYRPSTDLISPFGHPIVPRTRRGQPLRLGFVHGEHRIDHVEDGDLVVRVFRNRSFEGPLREW